MMKKVLLILAISLLSISSFGQTVENLEYYIQNKKIGLRDKNTKKIIVPCKYDFIGGFSLNLAPVKLNGKWGYVNNQGQLVIPLKFQEAKSFSSKDGLAPAKMNGLWGFINKSGSFQINPKYNEANGFSEGRASVCKDGLWGFINPSEQQLIPFEYSAVGYFGKTGFCIAEKNGKWGRIDINGCPAIDFKYDNGFYINDEGYARCCREGRYGLVREDGREVIPCKYDDVSNPSEGLVRARQNGKYGYLDYNGNIIINFIFNDAEDFINGLSCAEDEDYCYILSSDSRTLAKLKGDDILRINYCDVDIYRFYKYVDHVRQEYLIDKEGKYITTRPYADIGIFYGDGLIAAKAKDKWGFIDIQGTEKIPFLYDDKSYHFQFGIIAVKKGGKWGIIDVNGNEVTPFKYDKIDQSSVFSKTKIGDKYGALDAKGKEVLPNIYDEVKWPNSTYRYFPVILNGQEGYADYYGNNTF